MVDEHDRRVIEKGKKGLARKPAIKRGVGSLLEILSERMEPLPGHTHSRL
jgi:hypothetical protein